MIFEDFFRTLVEEKKRKLYLVLLKNLNIVNDSFWQN